MDQYLSGVESTAMPYILAEYQIEAAEFAALKSRFLIVTFFVFALNALNDLYRSQTGDAGADPAFGSFIPGDCLFNADACCCS